MVQFVIRAKMEVLYNELLLTINNLRIPKCIFVYFGIRNCLIISDDACRLAPAPALATAQRQPTALHARATHLTHAARISFYLPNR